MNQMNELRVTMRQFAKLHKLAAWCTTFLSSGASQFDEERWARGITEILGYLPPPGEYRIVVGDQLIAKIR